MLRSTCACYHKKSSNFLTARKVLENMLLHLKKFSSWEFIAFLLRKSIQAGICVVWDTLQLENHNLTGQRLKELSRGPDSGCVNCHLNDSLEPDTPQPQESIVTPQRSDLTLATSRSSAQVVNETGSLCVDT